METPAPASGTTPFAGITASSFPAVAVMKFFDALLAAPLVSLLSRRADSPASSINPPVGSVVSLTRENAVALFPELTDAQIRDTNACRPAEGRPLLVPHATRKEPSPTRVHSARNHPLSLVNLK